MLWIFLLPALWIAVFMLPAGWGRVAPFCFLVAINITTVLAYGMDKLAARSGSRRISEKTLHLLGIFGGWPGALAAQRVFHHKTKDRPFQRRFWAGVLVNCALWAGLIASGLLDVPFNPT